MKAGSIQPAEKLGTEGGGGFNPRMKPTETTWALAPERRIPQISSQIRPSPSFLVIVRSEARNLQIYRYATGLMTFALLRAGVKPDDPKLGAALKWLNQNQQADGSWPGVSINVDRKAGNIAEFFMSDAATAWAVIALLEAETTK